MVKQAVIFMPVGGPGEKVLLGHPLVVRAMIAAARAGVDKFMVVTAGDSVALAETFNRNRVLARQDCVIECVQADHLKADPRLAKRIDGDFLLLGEAAVFRQELLARFAGTEYHRGETLLLLDSDTRPLRDLAGIVRVHLHEKTGRLHAAGHDIDAWNAAWTGIAICPQALFGKLLTGFMRQGDGFLAGDFLKFFPPQSTRFVYSAQEYALNATTPELRVLAEKTLLQSVRKATDGFVSRHFNRYVSLFLSRQLIRVNASPNFISGANLLLGVFAAVLLAAGGYVPTVIAALLFQFTSIVDGSDGEVAKLTWKMSPKGAWIDTICDQITYVLFFVALPLGLYNAPVAETEAFMIGGQWIFLALGGVTLAAFGVMFWLMSRYVKRVRGEGSMLQILKDIEESARQPGLGGMLDRIVARMSFIFRRDFFAFATMIVLIAGFAGALMWTIAALCVIQVLYLYFYSQRRFRMIGRR